MINVNRNKCETNSIYTDNKLLYRNQRHLEKLVQYKLSLFGLDPVTLQSNDWCRTSTNDTIIVSPIARETANTMKQLYLIMQQVRTTLIDSFEFRRP